MKSTGVVRPIDQLGRIVIPIQLRRNLNLKELDPKTGKGDKLEIFIEGENALQSSTAWYRWFIFDLNTIK